MLFFDDNPGRGTWFQYSGTLVTLPISYLCPRHAGLVKLPIRMAWPTSMNGATVADLLA